jgi:hypothetical protein
MLASSMALIAFVVSANSAGLNWQPDYSKAIKVAAAQHRPVAVFIGQGKPESIAESITDANRKLLNESYICVYIDATTPTGKKLADSFEMNQGLVISNSTAEKQALRLLGAVTADDLNASLVRFSDPNMVVNTTATTPHVIVAPAAPVFVPAPAFFAPAPGGCANGRCPNAR